MTFPEWFTTVYQQPGEPLFNAIHRMAMQIGIGWTTVMRAVKGSRVQNASASVLAAATSGAVDVETLKHAPTRREQREQREQEQDDTPRTASGSR